MGSQQLSSQLKGCETLPPRIRNEHAAGGEPRRNPNSARAPADGDHRKQIAAGRFAELNRFVDTTMRDDLVPGCTERRRPDGPDRPRKPGWGLSSYSCTRTSEASRRRPVGSSPEGRAQSWCLIVPRVPVRGGRGDTSVSHGSGTWACHFRGQDCVTYPRRAEACPSAYAEGTLSWIFSIVLVRSKNRMSL
jgi:hypothetical protein